MNVIVIMRLANVKAKDHILPLLSAGNIEHVTLVRHAPVEVHSHKLTQLVHTTHLDEGTGTQNILSSLQNLWLCFYNGMKIARNSRYHAVVTFNFVPYGVIGWAIARLNRKKAVAGLIGTDFNLRLQTGLTGSILKLILSNCDAITIFGEAAKYTLVKDNFDEKKIFILPHAIDTNYYAPDPSMQIETDIIYVGYLRELKRVDRIIKAMQIVLAERKESTLWIVGDGPARKSLEELAKTLNVDHAVQFLGWSENPVEYLRKARIFVSLSDYEGLPMSTIEALCTGLPVVVTNVGALKTLVDNGTNGYLVAPSEDVTQAAACMLRILTDQNRYQQMRDAALDVRDAHTYEYASSTWEHVTDLLRNEGTDMSQ